MRIPPWVSLLLLLLSPRAGSASEPAAWSLVERIADEEGVQRALTLSSRFRASHPGDRALLLQHLELLLADGGPASLDDHAAGSLTRGDSLEWWLAEGMARFDRGDAGRLERPVRILDSCRDDVHAQWERALVERHAAQWHAASGRTELARSRLESALGALAGSRPAEPDSILRADLRALFWMLGAARNPELLERLDTDLRVRGEECSLRMNRWRFRLARHWIWAHPDRAERLLETASRRAASLGDQRTASLAQNWLGLLHENSARDPQAYRAYAKAAEGLRSQDDPRAWGYNRLGLGFAAWRLGRAGEALLAFDQGHRTWAQLDSDWGRAQSLLNLGAVHSGIHELHRARKELEQALELSGRVGDARQRSQILNNLAVVCLQEGDPEDATLFLEEAIELARLQANPRAECDLLVNMGLAAAQVEDLERARLFLERACARARELGVDDLLARVNLGSVLRESGDVRAARRELREVVRLAKRRPQIADLQAAHYELGLLAAQDARYREGLRHLTVTDSLCHERGLTMARWTPLLRSADYALRIGDVALARRHGSELSTLIDHPTVGEEELAELADLRARIAMTEGDVARARKQYQTAMRHLRRRRLEENAPLRPSIAGLMANVLDGYLEAGGGARQGFAFAQLLKSRTLLEQIEAQHERIAPAVSDSLLERDRDARLRVRRLEELFETQTGEADSLAVELARARGAVRALRHRVLASDARYRRAAEPTVVGHEALGRLAPPGTLLLEYVVPPTCEGPSSRCEVLLFAVDRFGVELHRLGPKAEIERSVVAWTRLVSLPDADTTQRRARERLETLLYQRLIAPAHEKLLQADYLLVAPDGCLHGLPFAALADSTRTPLARRFPLALVPCLSIAAALDDVQRPETPDVDLAIWLDASDDLSFARWESEQLQAMVPRSRWAPLPTGDDAPGTLRRSGLLQNSRVLHFASHGWFDPIHPWESALLLRSGTRDQEPLTLQAIDLYEIDLRCDLVTLAICESARPGVSAGEGLQSFAHALFGSGTPSVLATLWPIDDRSTARFMLDFYRALGRGRTKAESLQAAQVRAMARPDSRDPYHWAGYVLLGEGWRRVEVGTVPGRSGLEWWLVGLLLSGLAWGLWRTAPDRTSRPGAPGSDST